MAGNFAKPVTTDLYTDILTLIRENQTELAKMLDGSTATNIPTGAKRWNETNKRFEKFDGSTWTALVPDATTSASGLMSAADKTKVDTLKTGSSTDKQTSVTDATAGRLLINAAFGLAGASAPTSLSAAGALDSISQTSAYIVSSANVATVNGPSGAGAGVVFTLRYSSTYAVQHYFNVNSGYRSWSRQCNNGTWSAWVENLHTGNIAPTHIPEDATHRWATDAEKMNWNSAKTHADSAHAPSTAQKNSDITKAEIEAKLTGTISTHTHPEANADTVDGYHAQKTPAADKIPVAGADGKLDAGWLPAALSNPIHGQHLYTSPGTHTFTVPNGVTAIWAYVRGGGGGGAGRAPDGIGEKNVPGGGGGSSSIGAYITATGGAGQSTGGSNGTCGGRVWSMHITNPAYTPGGTAAAGSYGGGGGGAIGGNGFNGGEGAAYIAVTPGEVLSVTVGSGGAAGSGSKGTGGKGGAGVCAIAW